MTGLWFVSAESSAVALCYCFLALKRTAVGFGHFVFTLGRINTYSAFLSRIEFFRRFEDMEVMDFGYCYFWIWIYTRYVRFNSVFWFGFFEWLCEEILTIGSRDITKLIRRISFVF